jgi:hypothetical protein
MQAWQGMVGFLQVGNVDSPGSPDNDLAKQGVIRDEFIALWEWSVDPKHRVAGTSTFFEGNFIQRDDYLQSFLTNNGYQPTYSMYGTLERQSTSVSSVRRPPQEVASTSWTKTKIWSHFGSLQAMAFLILTQFSMNRFLLDPVSVKVY